MSFYGTTMAEKTSKKEAKEVHAISKRELEIVRWTKRFIRRYRKSLEALAKK